MVCGQRAPPTGPVEETPGQDRLVDLLLHQRLVPRDVVLLLLCCEPELHLVLLFPCPRKGGPAALLTPGGQTASHPSVLRHPPAPRARPASCRKRACARSKRLPRRSPALGAIPRSASSAAGTS